MNSFQRRLSGAAKYYMKMTGSNYRKSKRVMYELNREVANGECNGNCKKCSQNPCDEEMAE